VVQGICAAHPKGISSVKAMVHLWYHENMRVYHDRLVNSEDKEMFIGEAVKLGNTIFEAAREKNKDKKAPQEGEGEGEEDKK